ncbi:MAG: hypothetical protein COU27_01970 [Candidatus Levybacteria bacterium CG10_big_fil_rev_8_21_14_0_10_36_7]|nr:MAG: hypothetical protein COU27_01970 [Candidatus Levybacteria bacterium CG10_big_fil_rev_8_21_14_0_10_36_7]
MLYLKNKNFALKHIFVIPVLSLLVIPILILDICVEIYHRTCFPLCRLPYIKRSAHIKIFDRGKLKYLTFWQKLYCMYCGYGNGVVQYWRTIANTTEEYWCGVKHKQSEEFVSPEHQKDFSSYESKEDFIDKYRT